MKTTSSLLQSSPLAAPAASRSRRSFLRYLTIGAAAAVVEGCGGGGGATTAASPVPAPAAPVVVAPVAPAPVVTPPVVTAPAAPASLSIPNIAFTQGIASSFSVVDYISAANLAAVTLTLNATPLPAGVTFNPATRAFDYDGRGAVSATEGHVLTAIGA